MSKISFLPNELIKTIHHRIITKHGGENGFRDESNINKINTKMMEMYLKGETDIIKLATEYTYIFRDYPPFKTANSRVPILVICIFLELNGYQFKASNQETAFYFIKAFDREISKDEFAKWLKDNSKKNK